MMPGPLELFAKEQRGKLISHIKGAPIIGKDRDVGLIDGYLSGRNLRSVGGNIGFSEADAVLAARRSRAVTLGGGLLAANTLGIDPLGLTGMLNNVAALGVHGTAGHTMYKMGGAARIAGLGYLGIAGINTFRTGDNLGPQ